MEKESNGLCAALLAASSIAALVGERTLPQAGGFFSFIAGALALLAGAKILDPLARFLPKPFGRIIHWIHSLAFEGAAISAAFCLRPFGLIKKIHGKRGPSAGRPVLFIHGYLQNGSNWEYLKRFLAKSGIGPLYSINLVPPFGSISDLARLVSEKAEEIARETGRQDLSIVGHSMGGLVAAWYASKIAAAGKVARVITLGSPLGGTHLAAIALGANGREMRVGSPFVEEIQEAISQSDAVPFYHIASSTDQIILPYQSALTGLHPERETLFDNLGHMSLLFSPRVARKIREWL